MALFHLMFERQIELESANLSILSFKVLDSLLLSKSLSPDSEDVFLQFLSEDELFLLNEYFGILRELV
jgi:hypothetical protein